MYGVKSGDYWATWGFDWSRDRLRDWNTVASFPSAKAACAWRDYNSMGGEVVKLSN